MTASTVPGAVAEVGMRRVGSGLYPLRPALGRNLPAAFVALLRHSPETAAAVDRYLASIERLKVSSDAGALAIFRAEADLVEASAARLTGAEREAIRAEVRAGRAHAEVVATGSLRPGEVAPNHVTRPKFGQKNYLGRLAEEAGRIERKAAELMRKAADGGGIRGTAIDRIGRVVGPTAEGGWRPVAEYLAENQATVAKAERRYAAATRAAKERPGGASARELQVATKARQGYHNKVKGALGEAYVSRCAEWTDLRGGFVDVARRRAAQLNQMAVRQGSPTRWTTLVATLDGRISIDGKDAWDEAVLIVEQVRPGMNRLRRAELVAAAQYKVEKRVSALEQVISDVERERGGMGGQARLTYRVSGATSNFNLLPTGGAHRPTRLIFNADGGKLSAAAEAAFKANNVQVWRGVLKASVAEFDIVADELLAAAAAVSDQ
jgi:hypothetical protein